MKLAVDNGYIVYQIIGNGIPLLFIHGYPLSRKIWDPQLEDLSTFAKIITLDLRGHGDSFPFAGPYHMDVLASDCIKALNVAGINEPVVICGLSMGGYVSLALYRNHPELFRGIILTSTRAAADSIEGKANRDASIRNLMELGVDHIVDNMLPKLVSPYTFSHQPDLVNNLRQIMIHTSPEGIIGALSGMRDRPDSTELLNQLSCPVLIVHGIDDQLIPIAEAEHMHAVMADSKLVRIPDAGHLPNMEQPELFNRALSDFLRSLS
jgi:pimeloyl-ACP methyl ester carboxylesterase